MDEYCNETEHIVFDDFQLKIYDDSESSNSSIQDEKEYVIDSETHIIKEIFDVVKDFSLHNYVGLFDEMKLSDVMGLIEDFQNIVDIDANLEIPCHKFYNKRYPTLEMWCIHYSKDIRNIYDVFTNECMKYEYEYGTFERFLIFGFEHSSSTIVLS